MGQTRNLRDGVIKLKDGTGTPLELTLALDMGNLQFTEKVNHIQVKDRGVLDHTRPGDQEAVALSFGVKVDRVSEASSPYTLRDALKAENSASAWVTVGNAWEPYQLIVEFTINDPDTSGSDDETITFNKFHPEEIEFSEGDEFNELQCSGFSFETKPTYS